MYLYTTFATSIPNFPSTPSPCPSVSVLPQIEDGFMERNFDGFLVFLIYISICNDWALIPMPMLYAKQNFSTDLTWIYSGTIFYLFSLLWWSSNTIYIQDKALAWLVFSQLTTLCDNTSYIYIVHGRISYIWILWSYLLWWVYFSQMIGLFCMIFYWLS